MKTDKSRGTKRRMIIKGLMACIAFTILFHGCFQALPSKAGEKWTGIDESVIKKYANAYGREASPPLISTEGDLLLFLFLLAGTVGGFILGYCWRMLTGEKAQTSENKTEDSV